MENGVLMAPATEVALLVSCHSNASPALLGYAATLLLQVIFTYEDVCEPGRGCVPGRTLTQLMPATVTAAAPYKGIFQTAPHISRS
eukprot:4183551-Amphidinium_carterae.1